MGIATLVLKLCRRDCCNGPEVDNAKDFSASGLFFLFLCGGYAVVWCWALGWLSKKVFAVSKHTYLCPMSCMHIVSWTTPDSVASFFAILAITTAGLTVVASALFCFSKLG